jgi:hypothetical protein
VDASVPPAAFIVAWLAADHSVGVAAAAAIAVSIPIAAWRLLRRQPPRAILLGLLGLAAAAAIALHTGRAADFFVLQVAVNAASALAWIVSIVLRWPLLGVAVGSVLGQGGRWRRDRTLLRAYSRASWVWVCQYLLRIAVFTPLWLAGDVVALGLARIALSWPLVAACLFVSWRVLRSAIPGDHPGLRHPRA